MGTGAFRLFKGASAGNFMGKGGLSRMFKGVSAGNFMGKGGERAGSGRQRGRA